MKTARIIRRIKPKARLARAGWVRPDGYWRPNGIPDSGPPSPCMGVVTEEQEKILAAQQKKESAT